ncbi:hypothetical protein [Thalassobellus suaedae]|uniref:Uncharacterized protein n=1 Tax=Thalassobellus suaedae TaxID=3074124 RepID=A0ABY9Y2W3_9FLAO|nr:hypothetical protein RHP49_16880 [Flavobacteriaceae bacterium HL-DH10]
MKAETVFEVYKALNHFEQNRLNELIKDDLNKVSKLDYYEDTVKIIARNLLAILDICQKRTIK